MIFNNFELALRQGLRLVRDKEFDPAALQHFIFTYMLNCRMSQAERLAAALLTEASAFDADFLPSMRRLGCRLAYATVWLATEELSGAPTAEKGVTKRRASRVSLLVNRTAPILEQGGHYGHLEYASVYNDRVLAYSLGYDGIDLLLNPPSDSGALRGLVVERMAIAAADREGLLERLVSRFASLRNLRIGAANLLFARIERTVAEASDNDPWTSDAPEGTALDKFELHVALSDPTTLALIMANLRHNTATLTDVAAPPRFYRPLRKNRHFDRAATTLAHRVFERIAG